MSRLKIITLLDKRMCDGCRFRKEDLVEDKVTGKFEKMIHCTRLDCDNWKISEDPHQAEIVD